MRNKHFGSTYNAIHMMYFFYDPYGPLNILELSLKKLYITIFQRQDRCRFLKNNRIFATPLLHPLAIQNSDNLYLYL